MNSPVYGPWLIDRGYFQGMQFSASEPANLRRPVLRPKPRLRLISSLGFADPEESEIANLTDVLFMR